MYNQSVDIHTIQTQSPPFVPNTWDRKLARVVSNAANPTTLAFVISVLTAATLATAMAWMWAGIQILTTIFLPMGYIIWLLKRGRVTDIDVFIRQQRKGPYLVTFFCGAIALLAMWFFMAPPLMIAIVAASMAQTIIMFLINTRWKISAHSAAMASFVVVLLYLIGSAALPAAVGMPLIIWSRVRLKRHTFLQTVGGSLLGFGIFAGILLFAK
jgi:membrane-associated phospholipid phosphatase